MANLVEDSFFSIRLKSNIYHHPFVQKRVIPALEKTHPKQISLLKAKYKKRYINSNIKGEELEEHIWYGIFIDLLKHYTTLAGADRGLYFGLFSGGASQHIVWDNLKKNLYPTDNFDFDIPFSKDPNISSFAENNEVFFRGKIATSYRDGARYSVLKIYFYVQDNHEKRDVGDTTISTNVGILCEIPYFFLRSDRYKTFQDENATNALLELFELEKDKDIRPFDLDFIPTDELGEMYHNSTGTDIGNEYAGVYIQ